jgi:hypothetical protein
VVFFFFRKKKQKALFCFAEYYAGSIQPLFACTQRWSDILRFCSILPFTRISAKPTQGVWGHAPSNFAIRKKISVSIRLHDYVSGLW